MNYLFVLHDAPYGSERVYNGLRWAKQMINVGGSEVKVFLFADAVGAAADGQKTPEGYYNVGNMVNSLGRHGGEVGCCGACLDARGISEEQITKGAHRSSMAELTDWTLWADKVINV
jgi:uncharacterized protein involved in oxidation of intracellular sulfur